MYDFQCTPAKIKDIHFTCPTTKRRLEETPSAAKHHRPLTERNSIPPHTDEEMSTLFATLNQCKTKPQILRVLGNYADQFVPIYEQSKYPEPLSSLYAYAQLKVGYLDLLSHYEVIFDTIKVHFFSQKIG